MPIENDKGPGGVDASYGPRGTLQSRVYDSAQKYGDTFREGGDGPAGGSGSIEASSGLLINTVEGQDFAQIPVGPAPERPIYANVVMRSGNYSAISALSGAANEVGVISDQRGLILFNGTPGGGLAIYPDSAGRTMVVEEDAGSFESPIYTVTPDVSTLILRNTGAPSASFQSLSIQFSGSRSPRQPFRLIQDAKPVFLNGTLGGPDIDSTTVPGGSAVVDFIISSSGSYTPVLSAGAFANGSVFVGGGQADGNRTLMLGQGGRAYADNEQSFGNPAFSGLTLNQRMHGFVQAAGLTSATYTTAVLTDSGVRTDPGIPIDSGYFTNGVHSFRLEIIGKVNSSSDFCRFVRDVVVSINSSGTLTLHTPTTQNNPSDLQIGTTAGTGVAFSVNNTNKTLVVTVTGATGNPNIRWYCVGHVTKLGNA